MMLTVLMKKLNCITRLNEFVGFACDTSFIYWHRLVISVYFEHLFETKVDAYRINVRYFYRLLAMLEKVVDFDRIQIQILIIYSMKNFIQI